MRGRLALLALLLIAAPAGAQVRHNSNAPIDFSAGTIELQDRANRAILSGGVNVRQADMTLEAQRMTVAYTGRVTEGSPQVSRLDASGGVTVTRPSQRARSQYAVYDLNRRVITMLGGVTLVEGAGNTVSGGRLTINLDTGRATIDGSSVGTTRAPDGSVIRQGGRVTGRFSVPDRTQ
ncbi:MAG: OstA family protein [Sphingomonadales bacterium]|nr:OstA family protein [Sphingomonadales bacterium]